MNIYVGNLSYQLTEDSLKDEFSKFGTVASCKIITDRDTGRPKGFGFIEMSNDDAAKIALSELNGKELDGRAVRVSEAKPRS